MGTIRVDNIRVYSYHGCLSEETKIGSDYLVNVKVKANLSKAIESDELRDTVDYVQINRIVVEEMGIPSKLLEHVAKRIGDRIFKELPMVKKSKINVAKVNPPINGDVEKVSVNLSFKRQDDTF
ncbi:dihydroneopterin aldolase [Maribacter cobaltidurans]|uniref:7,8-dihydroneopterin aldolase n=1 Tax=Maribacter cobaltidurans TaxID=1178778 RepID=A0A223V5B4_9FLAO|nr:dihydroneopterin aldolase [Maribacter cobaltidurans]ASV30208.1 dihydroneopterin aldolase [Maribacter cobaltidurans]GGD76664.1 7,8-dihydroneopterin aldolase [Maribacter cobaltidurans]